MCLGVPGRVTKVETNELGMAMGTVDFGGITKEVCLAYVPDVKPGEYVIVHVGFALSRVSEEEAQRVFEALDQLGELDELDVPQPGESRTGPADPPPGAAGGAGTGGPGGGPAVAAAAPPRDAAPGGRAGGSST